MSICDGSDLRVALTLSDASNRSSFIGDSSFPTLRSDMFVVVWPQALNRKTGPIVPPW